MNADLIDSAVRSRDQLIARGTLSGDAALLGQCLKVQEEAGEMAEAMLGVLGANPRKGFSHTREDLLKEVIDVVLSATVLAVWIEGGQAFAARLDERLTFLADRAERR